MLPRSRLMAFVATTDAERAKGFYEHVLGLTLVEDGPFALVFDANGTELRIQKVEAVLVASYTVLGWKVDSISAEVLELGTKGVTFERYPGLDQDQLGIWRSPDGDRVAWFRDPDGHVLSLTEHLKRQQPPTGA